MNKHLIISAIIYLCISFSFSCSAGNELILCCKEDNDLYVTLKKNNVACQRYQTPTEAIDKANNGSGVMILADDYPAQTTKMDASLFEKAKQKNLRLYVEYPSALPGMTLQQSRRTRLERVVVATNSIKNLSNMQILALNDCYYVPVSIKNPLLAVSKVAGFDYAVYGLDGNTDVGAVLFEHSSGSLLVSTTKLSQFIKARYAPKEGMQALWSFILQWVGGDESHAFQLDWTPEVRPSYAREEKLPDNATRIAVQKGIDWHTHSKMLLSEQGWEEYKKFWNLTDANMLTTVPTVDNSAPQPVSPVGDGTFGLLEGVVSAIHQDGSQPTRWWLRADNNGESSLAFALRWVMDGDQRSKIIAGNLLDWVYSKSGLFQNDPLKANYGLLFWAPGNAQALYQENDIRVILGCLGTAGALNTDRWDEALVKNILGNFRTTGTNGFRGWRLENPEVLQNGWQYYWNRNTIQYQPHYEAWTWSSYLWLYDKTGWKPLLDKTLNGIRMMMNAYPDNWKWTNGIQQERGRMLLTLAWLIRIDDKPEYRAWLKRIADDMERCQDESGAIREELGALDHGDMAPPTSNASYGTHEAPLIQTNGDKVADLLYTCNFTFLGLHEAYAATGDIQYKRMEDKLADFLIRVQVKSEKHSNLDGGWFRAFDYRQWEYWGSNADSGWGAWSIETGWTQGWISSVLAMRETNKNLWELSKNSQVNKNFDDIRKQMLPLPVTVTFKVVGKNGAIAATSGNTLLTSPATVSSDKEVVFHAFPDKGFRVKAWKNGNTTVNDKNLTYQLTVTETTVVTVEFETITGVDETLAANSLRARTRDGRLYVEGLIEGKTWSVYSVSGVLVYQSTATGKKADIKLTTQGVYIVQSDEWTVKVVFN